MRFAGGQVLNAELPKEKAISPIIDLNLKAHRCLRPCESRPKYWTYPHFQDSNAVSIFLDCGIARPDPVPLFKVRPSVRKAGRAHAHLPTSWAFQEPRVISREAEKGCVPFILSFIFEILDLTS